MKMRFMALRTTWTPRSLEWEPPSGAVIGLSGLLEATVTDGYRLAVRVESVAPPG